MLRVCDPVGVKLGKLGEPLPRIVEQRDTRVFDRQDRAAGNNGLSRELLSG
jgi:hypothetical protein